MTDLNKLTLERRIQALRKEAGLTQDALAERMGVTPTACLHELYNHFCVFWMHMSASSFFDFASGVWQRFL